MTSNKTKTLSFPYKHWNQLSTEELQRVKEIQCIDYEGRILMLLDIFLYLAKLRKASDSADVIKHITSSSNGEQEIYSSIDTLERYVNGDVMILEPVDSEDTSERYVLSIDMVQAYTIACTEWIEKDHTLISLPFDSLTIGEHEYKMPDGLLTNTTYQQYSNAQHYLEAYWDIMNSIESIISNTSESNGKLSEEQQLAMIQNVESLSKDAEDMQRGFLANMLTPYINQGEQRYDEDGKPYTFIRKIAKFTIDDEDIYKKDMEQAPVWLFPLIYQQMQDNLRQFRVKFPDLFKESGGGGKHDALVAELGTINVIIEKGGYANASAVYDENAVFIFKRLDMIQEEARLMKAEMNKPHKKK